MPLPTSVAQEMIQLGYLNQGGTCGSEAYALKRFQRRALTTIRMTASKAPLNVVPRFSGTVSGRIDQATVDEIAAWKSNGYVAPLGVWLVLDIAGGRLREDAAKAWTGLIDKVATLGGTIASPYGDTLRQPSPNPNVGASKKSFHIAGRAVDLNQSLANVGSSQRYFVVKEASGADTYWRIWCKTDQQNGTQGTRIAANTINAYRFGDGVEYAIPAGYYLDLTATLASSFERIKAQSGWGPSGSDYRKTECGTSSTRSTSRQPSRTRWS